MSNSTQLPAEVVEELNAACEEKYARMAEYAENDKDLAYASGHAEGWHTGATAYATQAYQAQQESEELKRWKEEQIAVCGPLFDYGQSKEANIPPGASITDTVLERCKRYDDACELLHEVLVMNEAWGDLPGAFITKVNTFLYGK